MLTTGTRKLVGFLFATLLTGVSASAFAQVPTNISYPINGMSYSNYIKAKFDANCAGGAWSAKWGFDSTTVGGGTHSHSTPSLSAERDGGYDRVMPVLVPRHRRRRAFQFASAGGG